MSEKKSIPGGHEPADGFAAERVIGGWIGFDNTQGCTPPASWGHRPQTPCD